MHLYAGQLEREERERATVRQSISRLQHEMSRLSSLISEKSGQQHRLEQNNVLMQNDIVHALKVQYTHICMYALVYMHVHDGKYNIHCTCMIHVYNIYMHMF